MNLSSTDPGDNPADGRKYAYVAVLVAVIGLAWQQFVPSVVMALLPVINVSGAPVHLPLFAALFYVTRDFGYVLILATAYWLIMQRPVSTIGSGAFRWRHLAIGAVTGLAFVLLLPFCLQPFHFRPTAATMFDVKAESTASGTSAVLFLIIKAGVSPIVQEAFFRGVLLKGLKTVMPTAGAVLASAAAFSAWHYAGGAPQMSFALLLGIVTAILCIYTRNIAASCAMHVVVNAHAQLSMLGAPTLLYLTGLRWT